MDQREINESRDERQEEKLVQLRADVAESHARTQQMAERNAAANLTIVKVMKGIDELCK